MNQHSVSDRLFFGAQNLWGTLQKMSPTPWKEHWSDFARILKTSEFLYLDMWLADLDSKKFFTLYNMSHVTGSPARVSTLIGCAITHTHHAYCFTKLQYVTFIKENDFLHIFFKLSLCCDSML